MTLITPDLIEKAARAMSLYDAQYTEAMREAGLDLGGPLPLWSKHNTMAVAALTAVIPDVVEKCAQAASIGWDIGGEYAKGRRDAGDIVRRLIPQEGK